MSSSPGAWPPGTSGQTGLFSAPAPGPDKGPPWANSTSVMFLLYMVIGFSATLALILGLLSIYYTSRCLCNHRRRAVQDPEVSEGSMMLTPKQLFLVLNPGGATTVAYREDEQQSMMPKNKTIEVKSIVIDMEATPLTARTLIPAYRGSNPCPAAGGPSGSSHCMAGSARPSSLEPCVQNSSAGRPDRDQVQAEQDTQREAVLEEPGMYGATSIRERSLPAPVVDHLHMQDSQPLATEQRTYYNALFMRSPGYDGELHI